MVWYIVLAWKGNILIELLQTGLRNDGIMKYTILDSTNKTATWKYKVSSHQTGRRNEDNK